ncbi:MAG: HEAT repeat domain-containing protein [Planctomycetota bacterium]
MFLRLHRPSLLRALLAAALVLPGATAQSEEPQQEPAARRLLHAQGGGVLRGESRKLGSNWEVRREGEWVALPAGFVTEARLEKEVLAEMRLRERRLEERDVAARAGFGEWMLDEGLLVEGLGELDNVLRLDPDAEAALAVLRRGDLHLVPPQPKAESDDERRQLVLAALARAGTYPPALREVVLAQLSGDEALRGQLAETLREQLRDKAPGVRATAALALRRLAGSARELGEAELKELLLRAARDVSEDVRLQASATLGAVEEEGLILPLVAALSSNSAAIRVHAAEALGHMGYPAAVEPLVQAMLSAPASGGWSGPRAHVFVGRQIAFVQGYDVDVAQNAAIGDPEIGTLQEGVSLDVRVLGVSGGPSAAQQSAALRLAVGRLTGSEPPSGRVAVAAWWQDYQKRGPPSRTGAAR